MKTEKSIKDDKILNYIKQYPPYKSHGDLGIDIRALSRYADEHGKLPADLSDKLRHEIEEIAKEGNFRKINPANPYIS